MIHKVMFVIILISIFTILTTKEPDIFAQIDNTSIVENTLNSENQVSFAGNTAVLNESIENLTEGSAQVGKVITEGAEHVGGETQTGKYSLEEQLKLAQEKVSRAQQEGAYSSGYSISDYRFNCDSNLFTSSITENTPISNFTFDDSVNIVSFSPLDDWNSFTISGKIPSLNWDFHALVSMNNYASASFVVVSLPQLSNYVIPNEQQISILSMLFSQYFKIKDSSDITFGNDYSGYFYDVSVNEEQLDKISLFLPYFPKPFESIVIHTKISGNNYLILLSTDFYPKNSFKDISPVHIYENQFCQILDSIRFESIGQ